jgi:hypothetical protein
MGLDVRRLRRTPKANKRIPPKAMGSLVPLVYHRSLPLILESLSYTFVVVLGHRLCHRLYF